MMYIFIIIFKYDNKIVFNIKIFYFYILLLIIFDFLQLSQYTITVIGEQPNIKKKIFALKKFIKIAKVINYIVNI